VRKDSDRIHSRRAMLHLGIRTAAGAGLLGSLESITGATANAGEGRQDRALVCVYLFGGVGEAHLISTGGALHPAAAELHALRQSGALRVVPLPAAPAGRSDGAQSLPEIMARRYASLRFLPNGFATPEWAARAAGLEGHHGAGAYTFQSGMSLVIPGGPPRGGRQFEKTGLRQAMEDARPLAAAFPNSALGRQMEDVSRLLRAAGRLELSRPVFLCAATGFTESARQAGMLAGRYRELSQAIAAFQAATVELGLERRVTTYTDGESHEAAKAQRARIVLGGAAFGGAKADEFNPAAGHYHASIASWLGLPAARVKQAFPEFAVSRSWMQA